LAHLLKYRENGRVVHRTIFSVVRTIDIGHDSSSRPFAQLLANSQCTTTSKWTLSHLFYEEAAAAFASGNVSVTAPLAAFYDGGNIHFAKQAGATANGAHRPPLRQTRGTLDRTHGEASVR